MRIIAGIFRRLMRFGSVHVAVILSIISMIIMNGEVYTLLIYLTLGLALIFVIIPNICALLWAKVAMSFILPKDSRKMHWLAACLLCGFIAFVPAYFTKHKAASILASYRQGDIHKPLPASPAHIKFIDGRRTVRLDRHHCDHVCQDLFLTGTVTSVTYAGLKTGSVSYAMAEGAVCNQDPNSKESGKPINISHSARQSLLDLVAEGKCIVKTRNAAILPDVIISQSKSEKADIAKANDQAPIMIEYKQIANRSIADNQGQVFVSQNDVVIERPFFPMVFGYLSPNHELIALGIMHSRDESFDRPFTQWGAELIYPDIRQRERQKSSIKQPTRDQKVEDNLARANAVLLEAPANVALNPSQSKIVSLGLQRRFSSVDENINAEVIKLALKILGDQRVQDNETLEATVRFLKFRPISYPERELDALLFKRLSEGKGAERAVSLELLKFASADARKAKGKMIMVELLRQDPNAIRKAYAYTGELGVSPVPLFEAAIVRSETLDDYTDRTHLLMPVISEIRCVNPKWRRALVPSLDRLILSYEAGRGHKIASGNAVALLNTSWNMPTPTSRKHINKSRPVRECR